MRYEGAPLRIDIELFMLEAATVSKLSSLFVINSPMLFSLVCTENIFIESSTSSGTGTLSLLSTNAPLSSLSKSSSSFRMSSAAPQADWVSTSVSLRSTSADSCVSSGIWSIDSCKPMNTELSGVRSS